MKVEFNSNGVKIGDSIKEFPPECIEGSLNLRQASLDDAVRYGGPITRAALSAMTFHDDRKNIVVDTRISFLLPNSYPSIPGWHTDGVPRGEELNPGGSGLPDMEAQVDGKISSPHYHLLVGGTDALPEFFLPTEEFDIPNKTGDMYAELSKQVNAYNKLHSDKLKDNIYTVNPWQVTEFDWWSIHTARPATQRGWRYLIRVTETDHIEPRQGLENFIRPHSQVYMPVEFGW